MTDRLLRMLVVDDDRVLRERLARAFRDRGFDVSTAADADEALAALASAEPDRAVVDLRMPGRSGLELVRDLRERLPAAKIVVLTGYGSIAGAVEAMKLGATNYLSKPADADDVLAAFEGSLDESDDRPGEPVEAPSLARAEWEHINRVLDDCGGNISEAARRLGVHRRSLQRKLQKYPPSS